MNKTKLKIHSSHFISGNTNMDLNNLKKISDLFFIKKYKGITIDVVSFLSDIIDIEYDESNFFIIIIN